MPVIIKSEYIAGKDPAGGPWKIPSMLVEAANSVQNWREFWIKVFLPRYLFQVQQNFETEGEAFFGWPELAPAYAAWKARHFPGTKILERTRRLRNSLAVGATGPDTLLQVGPLSCRVGTRVPWAKYHVWNRPFLVRVTASEWTPLIREFGVQKVKKAMKR